MRLRPHLTRSAGLTSRGSWRSGQRRGNVLQDQRFILEDEGLGQQGGDGVVLGTGLEHQALVSRYDVLLQLLYCPLPWERRTHREPPHEAAAAAAPASASGGRWVVRLACRPQTGVRRVMEALVCGGLCS